MDQHTRLGGDHPRVESIMTRVLIDALEAVALMIVGYTPPTERGLRFGSRGGPRVETPGRSGRRIAPRKESR
ncbi:MAG: hypothetical protein V9G19_02650 [Tetrasphaera sp.]